MQTNILDWLEATAAHTPEGAAVGDAQQDYTWQKTPAAPAAFWPVIPRRAARSRSIWKNPRRF